MGRRKAKFRWTDGEDEADLEYGTSRAQLKRDQEEWAAVILEVIELEPLAWASLPLDEFQREALEELHRLSDKRRGAFKRQLGYTKGLFRDQDVTELRDALAEGLQHQAPAAHTGAEGWTARLIAEGDSALMAFVDAHPSAERQVLRPLLRQALKTPKGKARRRLLVALRQVLSD